MQAFTISGADFFAAVSKVAHVVESRPRQPILQNVLFRIDGGALAITGTDLDRELTARASVTGEGSAECLALFEPLQKAAAAVKKLPAVALAFEEPDGEGAARLEIIAGTRVYSIAALAGEYAETVDGVDENGKKCLVETGAALRRVDDLPTLKDKPGAVVASRFTISGADFSNILGAVAVAMSQEETRYYLNGVYFFGSGEFGPGVVATDGHRLELHGLARYWRDAENVGTLGYIVPRVTVADLIKLARGAESVAVEFTETKLMVSGPSWEIISKLVDGTFPEFERVIPRADQSQAKVSFEAPRVVDFMKEAAAFSASRSRAVRFTVNGSFIAECSNQDRGGLRDEFPADITWSRADHKPDDVMQIGFNGGYFADALRLMSTAEVFLTDPASPAVIRSPELDGLRVLMPLRV